MKDSFSMQVRCIIKQIPIGKVASYGQIATYAGNPRAARQVGWILHSCSRKDNLPWHRVINCEGRISLPLNSGYELQKMLLENEGIEFKEDVSIDLAVYLWHIIN